jgi:hypothetical protein
VLYQAEDLRLRRAWHLNSFRNHSPTITVSA